MTPTPADVEFARWQGEVSAKLSALADQSRHIDDLYARISALETRVAWYAGASAMVGSVIGALGAVVIRMITGG